MPNDKTKTRNAEEVRINVNESYELQYWSAKFGVSRDELQDVVKSVGPMVADVQRELGISSRIT